MHQFFNFSNTFFIFKSSEREKGKYSLTANHYKMFASFSLVYITHSYIQFSIVKYALTSLTSKHSLLKWTRRVKFNNFTFFPNHIAKAISKADHRIDKPKWKYSFFCTTKIVSLLLMVLAQVLSFTTSYSVFQFSKLYTRKKTIQTQW